MTTPVTGTEAPQSGLPHDLHEPMELVKQYAMPATIGVGVAVVIVLGLAFYRGQQANTARDALMLLSSARSLDELERVVSDYGKSPAAPLALLRIAHGHFSQGNYVLAKDKYDAFTAAYPKHELAATAQLGVWQCAEAQGRLPEALEGYRSFVTQLPDHFLAAQSVLGQARCLQQLGKLTEARVVLEQFIAGNPEGAWSQPAEDQLAAVNRGIAKGLDGIVPSPATAATAPSDATAAFPAFSLQPGAGAETTVQD